MSIVAPLSLGCVAILTVIACLVTLAANQILRSPPPAHPSAMPMINGSDLALGILGCIASAVCFFSVRPDADDSFYLARAVLDFEHFWHPIAVDYPFAMTNGAGGYFGSLPSYEHLLAAMAWLVGRGPIDIYDFVVPPVAGFLVPLVWYGVIRRIGFARWPAVGGAAILLLLMLSDGETHRGLANFGLFRIWQGKVLLVTLGVPATIIATLDAVEFGRPRDWVRLSLISVAGIGLSTTAIFLLPVTVAGCAIAWLLVNLSPSNLWRALAAPLTASAWGLICVAPKYVALTSTMTVFASTLATDGFQVFSLVYGTSVRLTALTALAALAVLLAAKEGRKAAWIVAWTALVWGPMLVPPVAHAIVKYGTTADAFWRLAYAAPTILAVGVGAAAAFSVPQWRRIAFAVSGTMVVAASYNTLSARGISPFREANVQFPAIGYRVPRADGIAARALLSNLAPGTMLAPEPLAVALPMFGAKLRMALFREFDAPAQLRFDGETRLATELELASRYVSGSDRSAAAAQGLSDIAAQGLDYIVLAEPAGADERGRAVLARAAGYVEKTELHLVGYAVFARGSETKLE